jgi:hypothetical protein
VTGLPTILVKLDDFTGAFPYDITQYVRLTEGFTWTRGRSDELSEIQAGSLSLTLDNSDGRFTLGSVTYGIQPDQQIRVTVAGTVRWTGRVQSWPVAWPNGDDQFSVVTATATDTLATAARRTLLSALQEEILARSPSFYYTLAEASGATQAGDSSSNSAPPLTTAGTGAPVAFGTGTGPGADGLTATVFAGGKYLGQGTGLFGTAGTAPTTYSLGCWVSTSASGTFMTVAYSAGWTIQIETTGKVQLNVPGNMVTGTVTVNDGLTHFVMATGNGVTATLYVDGVSDATVAIGSGTPQDGTFVGNAPSGSLPFTGTISHVAAWATALSAGTALTIYNAGANGLNGELPAARVTRVAGYAGIAVGSLDSAGGTICGPAAQLGKSALDVFNEVAAATQGVVYADKNGAISSRNGYTVTGAVTPDATLDANWFDPGTQVEADMFGTVNSATGQATSSENQHTYLSAASITSHGTYPASYTWNVSTDLQALDRTTWKVNTYAVPASRIPSLTLDMLTLTSTAAALTLDLGRFLRVTGLPSQTPTGTTADLIVQGITETVSSTGWALTLTCTRRTLFQAWVLDDTTYSVLGTTTKLYI